jgi:hypothetical protein
MTSSPPNARSQRPGAAIAWKTPTDRSGSGRRAAAGARGHRASRCAVIALGWLIALGACGGSDGDHAAGAEGQAPAPPAARPTTILDPCAVCSPRPLACACDSPNADCPFTLGDLEARLPSLRAACNDAVGVGLFRSKGCGKIGYSQSGLSGGGWVFDAQTGRLVGLSAFSDVPSGRCGLSQQYGDTLADCPSVTTCALCGPPADRCPVERPPAPNLSAFSQ